MGLGEKNNKSGKNKFKGNLVISYFSIKKLLRPLIVYALEPELLSNFSLVLSVNIW